MRSTNAEKGTRPRDTPPAGCSDARRRLYDRLPWPDDAQQEDTMRSSSPISDFAEMGDAE